MSRLSAKIASLLVFISVVCMLVGCRSDRLTPNDDKQFGDNRQTTITVYICGAVVNPGYYALPQGVDVQTAIGHAVLCDEGILPANSLEFVSDKDSIIVDFVDGNNVRHSSVNANGLKVLARAEAEGVSAEVINALADYIDKHDKIRNRTDLESALGDLYKDNYYKFYVSERDYLEKD